ncbi:MAG: hypothetical protein P8M25_00730 [Paracoccaceae bacterium]|nr:hypothetical protein [Paracoccaceae bacterium]
MPRRDPSVVMRLDRMGASHQGRLSFMRILLRRMKAENWRFDVPLFEIDARGVGRAVYSAHGPKCSYSLVLFANDLPPEKRSDRVIATEWDVTFTLFDGIPTSEDVARLAQNIPKQEAGRVTQSELSVSRANRSVRLFDHVVARLASGQQPDPAKIADVGYLMRTTAVYGSGKLGAADREDVVDRPEFSAPFQVEMLSVYLTRAFVLDLVEHLAQLRDPDNAVVLDPEIRRGFGIGNSTGLGMAPFLLNHPALLNNWICAREEGLSRVRSLAVASPYAVASFLDLTQRAVLNADQWRTDHAIQQARLSALKADLAQLTSYLETADLSLNQPWNRLWLWAEAALGIEGQEQLAALMTEPYGDLVDGMADCMSADEAYMFRIDGTVPLAQVARLIEKIYGWALEIDWAVQDAQARVWYTSEEKLEPRLGERFDEPVGEYEQPLSPGRDVVRAYQDLKTAGTGLLAGFLLQHPEHRHAIRRLQIVARCPYAEIHDNTISSQMMPIDLLRLKLSFFGAGHFDPRSDRWMRITMFRNAPFPHELAGAYSDTWSYPPLSSASPLLG